MRIHEISYYKVYNFLEARSKLFHATLSVAVLALVSWLDFVTRDIDFILFYLAPVFLTNWYLGKGAGRAGSILSSVASFSVHLPGKYTALKIVWDFTADLLLFLLLGFMFRMLRQKYDEANHLALRDALTQALNRRSLTEMAEYQLVTAKRYHRPFSLAFIDIDNFKAVNDLLGHNEGDRLLCRVADIMRSILRNTDLVARWGGDEFVVTLPETGAQEAMDAVNRLREALQEAMDTEGWPATFSIGLVTCEGPVCSWEEILTKADTLMYQVKAKEKNGIMQQTL